MQSVLQELHSEWAPGQPYETARWAETFPMSDLLEEVHAIWTSQQSHPTP